MELNDKPGSRAEWEKAACKHNYLDKWGRDRFFPEVGSGHNLEYLKLVREAIAICNTCPIREPCLDYALKNDERIGVWGGMTETQRYKLRSQMGIKTRRQSVRELEREWTSKEGRRRSA